MERGVWINRGNGIIEDNNRGIVGDQWIRSRNALKTPRSQYECGGRKKNKAEWIKFQTGLQVAKEWGGEREGGT